MNPLIPELPEEIGLQCLIRVHHRSLPLLRRVCRRWKQATESPLFHRLRRSSGSSHPLIIFCQATNLPKPLFSPTPSFRLVVFHQSSGEWSHLPPIPFSPRSVPLFCGLAASNHHLVVIGGMDPDTFSPSTAVYVYSFLSGTWTRGAPMPAPACSFFACAAGASGQVFVAGGHDEKKNAPKSAMVYDVAKDEWTMLPEMARGRCECSGVFVDIKAGGLFVVVGGYYRWTQGTTCKEVFDVGEWRWRAVEEEAVEEGGWSRNCVAGGDGRVYMCGGGGESVVVVKEGEEWREVAELPEDVRVGSRMVGLHGGLMVVGTKSGVRDLAAYVLEMKEGTAVGWRRVEVPKEYSGKVQSACCIDV